MQYKWLVVNAYWIFPLGPDCATNNNGLEATNGAIKEEVTERVLLPILTFLAEICKWIKVRSERKDPISINHQPFVLHQTISTKIRLMHLGGQNAFQDSCESTVVYTLWYLLGYLATSLITGLPILLISLKLLISNLLMLTLLPLIMYAFFVRL